MVESALRGSHNVWSVKSYRQRGNLHRVGVARLRLVLGMLTQDPIMESCTVFLTIFDDSVKAEVEQFLRRVPLGWFRDEVCAISAACERALMRSAILPELRQLPKLTVHSERKLGNSNHELDRFARATVVKRGESGRRVVLLPDAHSKNWIR